MAILLFEYFFRPVTFLVLIILCNFDHADRAGDGPYFVQVRLI